MGEVIHVDENGNVINKGFKHKVQRACRKVQTKAKEGWEILKKNKETAIAVGSIVIPAAIEGVKIAGKSRARREENRRRKLAMWDPVEGHWWDLRRELSSREYLEIEERVKNGEKRGEVLYDMRVLR